LLATGQQSNLLALATLPGGLFVAGSQEFGCGGQLCTLKAITTVFLQVQKM
jgi:hypothetical protein